MTALLITVDTELSSSLHQRGVGLEENVRRSIWAEAQGQAVGIGWQMDMLDRHGLKGVFFLDPMPALVFGTDFLKPIVDRIVGRGHEVQLHIHTEWLAWARESPVGGTQGRNIGDFPLDDQIRLLGLAKQLLEQAGRRRSRPSAQAISAPMTTRSGRLRLSVSAGTAASILPISAGNVASWPIRRRLGRRICTA